MNCLLVVAGEVVLQVVLVKLGLVKLVAKLVDELLVFGLGLLELLDSKSQ